MKKSGDSPHWIWHTETHANQFVGALRSLTLAAAPKRASLRICADTKYKLYINGAFVDAGPAPFRKPVMSVDTHEVARHLRKGRNTIFVVGHFVGSTIKYNTVERPGLYVDLSIDLPGGRRTRVVTDAAWRVAELDCWKAATPKRNWAMEHVEDVDLAHPAFRILARYAGDDYAGGPDRAEPAELWVKPVVEDRPDLELRDRQVAPLRWRSEEAPLPSIFRMNTEIHSLPDNGVRMDHEYIRPMWDEESYEWTREGYVRFSRREGEPGVGLCYDFRRMCAGEAAVEILCEAPCTLDVGLAEAVRSDGHPIVWRNGSLHYSRFHLVAGLNRIRVYHSNGHRYLYLMLKDAVGQVAIPRVLTHHVRADLDFRDELVCTDRLAEGLYRISRRSLMLNTQAILADCNTREQGAYWGDSLWVAETVGHQTGDFRHMRNLCLGMTDEVRALGPILNGCLYGLGQPLYDYGLVPVEMLHRYHAYTGDLATVRAHLETARAIVEAYRAKRDANGLLAVRNFKPAGAPNEIGLLFIDHPGNTWHPTTTVGIDRRDYSSGFNLFYLQALQAMDALDRACGRRPRYEEEIEALTRALRRRFFVAEQGLLADAHPFDGRPPRFSQIVNALAITTGVLQREQARRALDRVLDIVRNPWISQGTPYSYFFLADAAVRTGMVDQAARMFVRDYTPMLARGATTTWEAWNADNHDSLNHAWSAPLPWLVRAGIMGLSPLRPGYRVASLKPCFEAFDQFSGRCCIPQGVVEVAWRRVRPEAWSCHLTVPSGVTVELTLPRGKRRFTRSWSGEVIRA